MNEPELPSNVQTVLGALDSPSGLLAGACGSILLGGFLIYRYSARHGGPKLQRILSEYRTVLWCFGVLLVALVMLGAAAWRATPIGQSFEVPLLEGFTASLAEDLTFFTLLGFIIILVQRREADRNRNLDDKIELLFSAKDLRSGEVAYLREELRKISADCRQSVTQIDVIDYDEVNEFVRIDVSRQYYVGNYLSSEDALYSLKINLTPDTYPGQGPSMTLFPTITNSVIAEGGDWRRIADDEILDAGGDLAGGQPHQPPEKTLTIGPGQVREFRSRFRGWQSLYVRDRTTGSPADSGRTEAASPNAGAEAPPAETPADAAVAPELEKDVFEVVLLKHWDMIEIHIRNSLHRKLGITISGNDSRSFVVLPGDEQRKAYRVENLLANSTIYISFTPG